MTEALLRCIEPVTRRLRQVRLWRAITLIGILFALLGWFMLGQVRGGSLVGSESAILLLIGMLAAWFAAGCLVHFSFHDTRKIAIKIEEKYPNLQQRLLTALTQISASGSDRGRNDGQLGYLQRRVIDETRDHARTHRWEDTVPPERLFWSRVSGVIATLAVAVILLMLAAAVPNTTRIPASRTVLPGQITVDPGNTAVERGTSLVVTARFGDSLPEQAELVCVDDDGNERRLAMKRNLDDPVLGAYLTSIDRPFTYQIQLPDRTSRSYRCEVFDFPSLVRSDASLEYPDYTGLERKNIEDTVRVAAVEGTSLKWNLFVNKSLASATLVDEQENRVELSVDAEKPELFTANFDLRESKRWTLELVDSEGRKNKYPPELIARVIPNTPPKLELTSASDARVSPLEEFPIGAKVRDDYGLSRVGFSYTFGDQDQAEVELASGIDGGQEEMVEHLVAFEELDAEPDQLLSYHFWAEDVGPDGEPRRTQSDLFFAEVRPFEEIFREGQQPPGGAQQQQQQSQNGQQAEELAELQKQIITATWNIKRRESEDATSDSYSEDVQVVADSQQEAMQQLEKLAGQLRDSDSKQHAEQVRVQMQKAQQQLVSAAEQDSLTPLSAALNAEQAAYQSLLKLRAREFQVTRQQQQSGQSSRSASQRRRQQQLEQLELKNEENRYETQQQAQQTPEQEQQREVRQVLSRLRDLARRQEDLNQQLAQLQTALEQAETEEEREEIKRQLQRLREQQEEMLREVDELSERMQTPENQEAMRDAAEQLSQTRENVQRATEALNNNDAAQALSEGTRAEREFEQMRDEFRNRAAGEFNDAVRDMRDAAQQLDEKQQELGEQLREVGEEQQPGLRAGDNRESLTRELEEQRQRLAELMNNIQETVEQAEEPEPLLAEELYDAFRATEQRQLDQRLKVTSELLKNGFEKEARQVEDEVEEGIGQLREQLEQATKSVLGDETKALERALGELEQLTRQLNDEIRRQNPAESSGNPANERAGEQSLSSDAEKATSANQRNDQDAQQQRGGEQGSPSAENSGAQAPLGQQEEREASADSQRQGRSGSPGEQDSKANSPTQNGSPSEDSSESQGAAPPPNESSSESRSSGSSSGDQSASSNRSSQSSPASGESSAEGSADRRTPGLRQSAGQSQRSQRSQQRSDGLGGGGFNQEFEGDPTRDPLTGEGFREWSDRLRDVEEMVADPELRSRAAQIRDRAREVRRELRRHSKEPHWPLVTELIAEPLRELRRDVAEELLRRSAEKNANVPIDRDPVPEEFADAVRQYYERLGAGR